jgi:nickel-dependent lactate racemase
MQLRLDYGATGLLADFPDNLTTVIEPVYVPPAPDPNATLMKAIQSPIGKPSLRMLYKRGQTIAISVCDITRAQPRQLMIEALLSEISGVRLQDVTILIAQEHTPQHRRGN